jgi:hypothetical protein
VVLQFNVEVKNVERQNVRKNYWKWRISLIPPDSPLQGFGESQIGMGRSCLIRSWFYIFKSRFCRSKFCHYTFCRYTFFHYTFCWYTFCRYTFCRYTFCRYTFCRYKFCCYTFCRYTFCRSIFCHSTFCRSTFCCLEFCCLAFCCLTFRSSTNIVVPKNQAKKWKWRKEGERDPHRMKRKRNETSQTID